MVFRVRSEVLRVLRLRRDASVQQALSLSLARLFLGPKRASSSEGREVFLYLETPDEISIVCEDEVCNEFFSFESSALLVLDQKWRAIQLINPDGVEASGIVYEISQKMAQHSLSIMCLCSWQSLWILVDAMDIGKATEVMENLPSQQRATSPSPVNETIAAPIPVPVGKMTLDDASFAPIVTPEFSDLRHLLLHPAELQLTHWANPNMAEILKEVIYPRDESEPMLQSYFFLSILDDSGATICGSLPLLEGLGVPVLPQALSLRALRITGESLGFSEAGIVATLSRPLASAKIPTFYLSSFDTDHVFCQPADLATVQRVVTANFRWEEEEWDDCRVLETPWMQQ